MRVKKAQKLLAKMEEGHVYRREELVAFSRSVDRELGQLCSQGQVRKAAAGLYYKPKPSRFGGLSATQTEVVRGFLKTNDFLLTSLNVFNGLAVGLTQLTNEMLVYNRKRFGKFKLAGLVYNFQRPKNFPMPSEFNEEYLFVDLLNNIDNVHEAPETERFMKSLKRKAGELRQKELCEASQKYAKVSANKLLKELTADV